MRRVTREQSLGNAESQVTIPDMKGGEQMGEKIKKRRMELGLSQEDLAKKAGVSRVQISNLERGASQFCTWKTVQKLSKALEVAPNYFFE